MIVLGLILLEFGSFKYFTSSDEDDNSNDKEEVKEDLTSEVLYTKTEEGLSKIITTNINGKEVSVVCARIDDSGCELKINNKFILNNTVDSAVESIYRVGSIIAILVGESTTDNGYLYLINSDGTVNSVIGNKMENSLMFKFSYSSDNFKVEGNKITFYMTSVQDERKLLVNGNLLIDVINEANQLSQYNVNDDTVAAAKYEIEYLGNGKFSEMTIVKEYSYKELKDKLNI